jgi:hypothetical protein
MTMPHTPGPWEWVESDTGHEIRMGSARGDTNHWEVQHLIEYQHGLDPGDEGDRYQFEEAAANARLIAAAPDLLAALLQFQMEHGHTVECEDRRGRRLSRPSDDVCTPRCAAMCAAIAKATGR